MSDHFEKSREANELRKSGKFREALVIYKELAKNDSDSFAAAGLLHCLRKQGLFEEALLLCDDLLRRHKASEWCRNEVIWTLIQGKLEKLDESATVEKTVAVAEGILELTPKDNSTKWRIVRRVLKAAKSQRRWDIISKWIDKVNPDELSAEPMKDESGREGWCDQAIWHNHHIRSMIEIGDKEQAILLSQTAFKRFPRQSKFFKRLEAVAAVRLSRLSEAERIYSDLCSTSRPDWWILHEHAQVLRKLRKPDEALILMCKAAVSQKKLDILVSLFFDIGFLCSELRLKEEARNHLLLCKFVREEKGWPIPQSIDQALSNLNNKLVKFACPKDLKDSLEACKAFWFRTLGIHEDPRLQSLKGKKIRQTLLGRLILGHSERAFCFIFSENGDSFFCLKNDLPKDVTDGATLVFDAIPSFDKKKNKESWKAINIRLAQST